MNAEDLRARIVGCTACPLSSLDIVTPVPWHGPVTPGGVVIVGEAPGSSENARGVPFVGPAGRLARRWLSDAGLDPDTVAWCNTCCCYPGRTPTQQEVSACRPNLLDQLALLAPSRVLLFGTVALRAWWMNLPIRHAHGHWWRQPLGGVEVDMMATYHPAWVLRQGGSSPMVAGDVAAFAHHERRELGCAMCGVVEGVVEREEHRGLRLCGGCEPAEGMVRRLSAAFPGVEVVEA